MFGGSADSGQVIQMPYFETKAACVVAGNNLLTKAQQVDKEAYSSPFYATRTICVPSR
jgi:hypothetical protein